MNWSNTEDSTLSRMYRSAAKRAILEALPGRSWRGVVSRARRLCIRRDPRFAITTVQQLYHASERRQGSGCWWWLGGTNNGRAQFWTVHLDRATKTQVSGARAVHYIHTGQPLGNSLAYMRCCNSLCVNPRHVAIGNRKDLGRVLSQAGKLGPTWTEERRQTQRQAARHNWTDEQIVLAIRQAPATITGRELAALHNLSEQLVSRYRSGKTHQHLNSTAPVHGRTAAQQGAA